MAQVVLLCFVLGSAHKFSIDICDHNIITDANGTCEVPINMVNFDHIKIMIWNKINEGDTNEAYKLKLFKVEIPHKEKNLKLNTINERFRSQADTELGDELDPTDNFNLKSFESSGETTHFIIVQPPATTGKCLPMVYLSNKKFAVSHISSLTRKEKPGIFGQK
jgi:hypothetical protein